MYESENKMTGADTAEINRRKKALRRSIISANGTGAKADRSTATPMPRHQHAAPTAPPSSVAVSRISDAKTRAPFHQRDTRVTAGTKSNTAKNALNAREVIRPSNTAC